jgi:hypothetical protein
LAPARTAHWSDAEVAERCLNEYIARRANAEDA